MPEFSSVGHKDVLPSEKARAYQFRQLSREEEKGFNNLTRDANQFPLTRSLLSYDEFKPTGVVTVSGVDFYVGSVLKTNDRDQAVMYVRGQGGYFYPRAFYKSQSDGGWRSCPYVTDYLYSKGRSIHYTQETKPHQSLLQYLEDSDQSGHKVNLLSKWRVFLGKIKRQEVVTDPLRYFFQYHQKRDPRPQWYTYDQEVRKYDDHDVLAEFQKYAPGFYDKSFLGTDFAEVFKNFDFSRDGLSGFVPDFKLPPFHRMNMTHTLLGQITLESYAASLNGQPIQWVMAFDKSGRVWIDRITFRGVGVNSYGVSPEVIDSGALTNKPVEYQSLVDALNPGIDYKKFNGRYVDITPLLDNLLPIKQFRVARNISPERAKGYKITEKPPTITSARSFDELKRAVNDTDGLQGSQHFFGKAELLEIIEQVRIGKMELNKVTRTGGLRETVRALLAQQKNDVMPNNKGEYSNHGPF